MAGKTTPVLLVTANVGSIFEDPSMMLKVWTEEFLATVVRLDPKFIALHCQEVGGKNYEHSMKHVEDFVRLFMSSEELRLFDKVRVYLDEDYSSAENFTALGNFYFIHESISDVLIWDFNDLNFVPAKGKEVHSGNIEAVTTKEKSKFPQDFFPECKWSRKGFLRTRWSLNGTIFDLINIHLFHDASNFIAMEAFPSVYCRNRRRALEHTLDRFHNDDYETAPFFVFGDFNFRTDTQGVVNKLADGLNPVRIQSNKNTDHTKLQYKDGESQVVLSLGKKEFSHADHQNLFLDKNIQWLKEFDRELEPFTSRLFEFSITFPPSYPFEENENCGSSYMKTRCPSWCDRVILSNTAKSLVYNISDPLSVEYGLIGASVCMGDHKPVFLKMDLINDAGMVSCCMFHDKSSDEHALCFGKVNTCGSQTPALWTSSCSSSSLKQAMSEILVIESLPSLPQALTLKSSIAADANCFLAPPHSSLLHEPYTPESMETPSSSPVPVRIQRDFGDIVLNDWESPEPTVLPSDVGFKAAEILSPGNNISTFQKLPLQSIIDIPTQDNISDNDCFSHEKEECNIVSSRSITTSNTERSSCRKFSSVVLKEEDIQKGKITKASGETISSNEEFLNLIPKDCNMIIGNLKIGGKPQTPKVLFGSESNTSLNGKSVNSIKSSKVPVKKVTTVLTNYRIEGQDLERPLTFCNSPEAQREIFHSIPIKTDRSALTDITVSSNIFNGKQISGSLSEFQDGCANSTNLTLPVITKDSTFHSNILNVQNCKDMETLKDQSENNLFPKQDVLCYEVNTSYSEKTFPRSLSNQVVKENDDKVTKANNNEKEFYYSDVLRERSSVLCNVNCKEENKEEFCALVSSSLRHTPSNFQLLLEDFERDKQKIQLQEIGDIKRLPKSNDTIINTVYVSTVRNVPDGANCASKKLTNNVNDLVVYSHTSQEHQENLSTKIISSNKSDICFTTQDCSNFERPQNSSQMNKTADCYSEYTTYSDIQITSRRKKNNCCIIL